MKTACLSLAFPPFNKVLQTLLGGKQALKLPLPHQWERAAVRGRLNRHGSGDARNPPVAAAAAPFLKGAGPRHEPIVR
jgi:hypothetical protein